MRLVEPVVEDRDLHRRFPRSRASVPRRSARRSASACGRAASGRSRLGQTVAPGIELSRAELRARNDDGHAVENDAVVPAHARARNRRLDPGLQRALGRCERRAGSSRSRALERRAGAASSSRFASTRSCMIACASGGCGSVTTTSTTAAPDGAGGRADVPAPAAASSMSDPRSAGNTRARRCRVNTVHAHLGPSPTKRAYAAGRWSRISRTLWARSSGRYGFWMNAVRASAIAVAHDRVGRVAGGEQHLQARAVATQPVGELAAAHSRHHDVGQQHVDPPGVPSAISSASVPSGGGEHGVAVRLEHRRDERPDELRVLDEQDRLGAARATSASPASLWRGGSRARGRGSRA